MTFGPILRDWRHRRRVSQLDLALDAGVSARHVSFLETGRSRPSRTMVLRLADHLDVPRDARNGWLAAAGFAPAYLARAEDDADALAARSAIDWMLERHAPYPAMAFDRHWRIVLANGPAGRLLAAFGIGVGDSLIDAFLDNAALRAAIENADEVARHTRERLVDENARYGGDPVLERAIARLGALTGDNRAEPFPAFVPVVYRFGEERLSLLSTFAHFATAHDIALAELRVELMFPADEATRVRLVGDA